MNRRLFLMGVAGALSGCSIRAERRLNVYNWSNYIAASTIPDFEKEFQCRVRYATYASAEEMLAKVMSGNSGWDVVFPSNSFVEPMRELGLLARLDHQRLSGLVHLEARFQSPAWDSNLEWCVPYMHGATGILYSKKAGQPPRRWADLWSAQYAGRMTMLDDPAEVFGACLKRLDSSINASDETKLRVARDLAIRQKPLLRAYLNEEVRDQLIAGDVLAAQMWANPAQHTMEQSPDLAFTYPEEGFPLYADNACILRESKRQELAHEFLNYLLRPEVAAAIAGEMKTATANKAAQQLLPAEMRSSPVLYPSEDVLHRGEWFTSLSSANQRLRDRLWTEIKAA